MLIPQGNWVVVERRVRDSTSRGRIVKAGLKEDTARRLAKEYLATQDRQLREGTPRIACNYWALPKEEF